jgi:hypothetical protein
MAYSSPHIAMPAAAPSIMPKIAHLIVTLPNHTRTADNPLGLSNQPFQDDKQTLFNNLNVET